MVSSYGYHIWLRIIVEGAASKPFLAQDTFYLSGASAQRVYIIPEHDLVIVRLGERPKEWDDAIIPSPSVRSLRHNK